MQTFEKVWKEYNEYKIPKQHYNIKNYIVKGFFKNLKILKLAYFWEFFNINLNLIRSYIYIYTHK